MPIDLLERTLELPVKSKIVTQPYVDFLTHQYQLSHNGAHGIEHWFRVLMNGRLIAEQTGADIEVIEHFALLRAATDLVSHQISENLIATILLGMGSHSMHWRDDLFQ